MRARERLSDDQGARRAFLVRIATTLADKVADVDQAIAAYRAVVDDFGADRTSLTSLASLYELADRWSDLADTLETHLGLAESPADKLALFARLGEVRQKRMGDVAAAIEAYRQALVIEPSDPGCRGALEAMLDDQAASRDAAAILRPLYETDGLHQKLLRVLEIEAAHSDSASDKLAMIAQAAQVAEGPLNDPALAFSYAATGLREAIAEPELPKWIERAERLTTATRKHSGLVSLLRSVVDEIQDGDLRLEVTLRIAEIALAELADAVLAKDYYARALDLRGDDRRALVALESLYERTGSTLRFSTWSSGVRKLPMSRQSARSFSSSRRAFATGSSQIRARRSPFTSRFSTWASTPRPSRRWNGSTPAPSVGWISSRCSSGRLRRQGRPTSVERPSITRWGPSWRSTPGRSIAPSTNTLPRWISTPSIRKPSPRSRR